MVIVLYFLTYKYQQIFESEYFCIMPCLCVILSLSVLKRRGVKNSLDVLDIWHTKIWLLLCGRQNPPIIRCKVTTAVAGSAELNSDRKLSSCEWKHRLIKKKCG